MGTAWQNRTMKSLALALTFAISLQSALAGTLSLRMGRGAPTEDSGFSAKKRRELTKAQAIARARAKFGGEALAAQRTGGNRDPRYRIKLLADGSVRIVWVDAITGAVSED